MGNALNIGAFSVDAITNAGIADEAFGEEHYDAYAMAALALGKRVTRDTATLPAGVATPYFTVTGGPILLVQIYGVVTTIVQTQACNAKLIANPTTGSDVDLCAVLNITAAAAGSFFTITGTVADALLNLVAVKAMVTPLIIPVGSIDLSMSATNTGATRWVAHYLPLESTSVLAAA